MEAMARWSGTTDHRDSRLLELLKKNSDGLLIEEFLEALELLKNPQYGPTSCWLCQRLDMDEPVVFDTGLCQTHAHQILMQR